MENFSLIKKRLFNLLEIKISEIELWQVILTSVLTPLAFL